MLLICSLVFKCSITNYNFSLVNLLCRSTLYIGAFRILFVSFLGFITQFQFVQWIKKLPEDKINSLLEFHIVPPEITQEAHRLFARTAEEQGSVSIVYH